MQIAPSLMCFVVTRQSLHNRLGFFRFSSSCSTLFGIVFSCLILKEFDNFLVMLLEGEG